MNCIIVDDDPIALRFVKQLVTKSDALTLIGECSNAEDALILIEKSIKLHSLGYVHNDIKYENLGLDLDGNIFLFDFDNFA